MLGIVLKYLPLFQVAAVIVASGILSLSIMRELFDTEQITVHPPGGLPPTLETKLKYTTRQAAIARKNFCVLTDAIYALLVTLLVALFISIAIEATILALNFWGNTGKAAGQSCFGHGIYRFLFCEFSTVARDAADQAKRGVENELTYPVGVIMFYLMLFGGVLIIGLGMAVRTVVDIRANHV